VTTTLSSKGQIVIPLEIRQRLGLPAGALISCYLQDGRIILDPFKESAPAQIVLGDGYEALEAPEGAPPMTPERVKEILSEL
jgi:AbrB family looped-hinge helix DNA binding protein